jgi:RimJ/RimL family protein N-acetyltransferase
MSKRDIHCLRLFTSNENHHPIGIVALSNIASEFGSATLWYVLGDKSQAGKGYTSRAVGAMLRHAFGELGLESVNAWAVTANEASRRVLEKNGFRPIGRQRCCHKIDGELRDRVLYDILAKEHHG